MFVDIVDVGDDDIKKRTRSIMPICNPFVSMHDTTNERLACILDCATRDRKYRSVDPKSISKICKSVTRIAFFSASHL
jgi:hypothetical protein